MCCGSFLSWQEDAFLSALVHIPLQTLCAYMASPSLVGAVGRQVRSPQPILQFRECAVSAGSLMSHDYAFTQSQVS